MRIGIIGSGRIGGNAGALFAQAGHDVFFSFSRDSARLDALAAAAGAKAQAGSPADAAAFADVLMLAVPWAMVDTALAAAGPLDGKILIDTTNQFGPDGPIVLPGGVTAAAFNQNRAPGARLVKAFNALTAGFQAAAAGRAEDERAVLFLAGDAAAANATVALLIESIGFAPVDLGPLATAAIMEAPRRPGSVYGEEYRPAAADQITRALRADPAEASRLAVTLTFQT